MIQIELKKFQCNATHSKRQHTLDKQSFYNYYFSRASYKNHKQNYARLPESNKNMIKSYNHYQHNAHHSTIPHRFDTQNFVFF
jgi:hypothetical protein